MKTQGALRGAALSVTVAMALILVVGLAVHQAILLVDAALAKRRRDRGSAARRGGRLSAANIVYAARDRAAMIVLVTLSTMASLIPLAVGTEVDSLFGSIALATAGGTIAGTIGAMWIVPVMLLGARRTSPLRGFARGR